MGFGTILGMDEKSAQGAVQPVWQTQHTWRDTVAEAVGLILSWAILFPLSLSFRFVSWLNEKVWNS